VVKPIRSWPERPVTISRSSVKNPPIYLGLIHQMRAKTMKGRAPTI